MRILQAPFSSAQKSSGKSAGRRFAGCGKAARAGNGSFQASRKWRNLWEAFSPGLFQKKTMRQLSYY